MSISSCTISHDLPPSLVASSTFRASGSSGQVTTDGIDARFEFEFVEMQPVWNEAALAPLKMRVVGIVHIKFCTYVYF